MILKNILGKTIDAAKKTAYQMYGEDFLVVDSSEATGGKMAKITIFSDKEPKQLKPSDEEKEPAKKPAKKVKERKSEGVLFERSKPKEAPKQESERLNALRRFAELLDKQDFKHNFDQQKVGDSGNNFNPKDGTSFEPGTTYKRSAIRTTQKPESVRIEKEHSLDQPVENIAKAESTGKAPNVDTAKPAYSAEDRNSAIELPPRNDQREIKALHKRFDKLEALLDSALISANLDYASHPAFQQLVKTGINTSIIAGWFSQIIGQGIDPFSQPELFMSKLAGILRSALGKENFDDPQKFLLFVGPSGAGKTSLIMKLSSNPEFMGNKKIAVVSVHPQKENKGYYTILKPFCEDHSIPYFEFRSNSDVNDHLKELEKYEQVFIDTPSINTEQNSSFREFWKIRQMLTPLAPLEIHYVVNASLNRFYFRDSSAVHHPLQPDYVAITHLDEISQWGPVIPFLEEMGCGARYISKGSDLNSSLDEFNPHWFAQKILQEN